MKSVISAGFSLLQRLQLLSGLGFVVHVGVMVVALASTSVSASPQADVQSVASVQVVASIRPLALIVGDIAPEGVVVRSLVPAWADPHSFQLKVSDASALSQADLIFWLGGEFERFLGKPLLNMDANRLITLVELPNLHWPSLESDGGVVHIEAGAHMHSDGRAEYGHKRAHEHDKDPHLWLNPENAMIMAAAVAEALSVKMPGRASAISENLLRFNAQVQEQKKIGLAALAPYKKIGFGVIHDAYNHYVEAFELTQLAAVQRLPDERLSAKKLMKLRAQLKGAACLVGEADTYANKKLAATLNLPLYVADSLAANESIASYVQFLEALSSTFLGCFSQR